VIETIMQYSTGNPVYDTSIILLAILGLGVILVR
jgi:hypothetical protein